MPNFNANQVVPVIGPGQTGQLFNNETPAAPQASQSLQYQAGIGRTTQKVWGPVWATPPSAAVVTLQSSNDNIDSHFQDLLTWTFAGAQLAPQLEYGPSAFYRYDIKSNTGGVGLTANFNFA